MKPSKKTLILPAIFCAVIALAQVNNVIDQVVWIVGDEAIFRSDIEEQYQQMKLEGTQIDGNPYCVIPEQMAVEKLYLHQAKLDTIEAPQQMINSAVEQRLAYFEAGLGSRERVEAYFRKSYPALREQLADVIRSQYIVNQVQQNLIKNVKATPRDVKKFYSSLSEDSIPYVPLQVEAQIIQVSPPLPQQEIEDVKARLRDYTDRINRGEAEFSSLAIMYSEDGSAVQGGELGFHGRADFVPEFSNVAFALNDPKKVSRIVETEYGFHIIQLIEKRGDQANFRHILLRPKVDEKDLDNTRQRLDSLRSEIINGTFTFEDAAAVVSQDKNTKNNKGIMFIQTESGNNTRMEMKDLPPEAARRIETMQPGDISEAFVMKDTKKNADVVAIVKLTNRIPAHRATLSDDYNLLKQMYEDHASNQILADWIEKKIRDTYVRIEDGWQDCDFRYKGWMKK